MDYATIVDEAVKQFYAAGNNEAHSWLLQVQASPEAWTFVWELLHPSKTREVQFFAATTLHAKISKQWHEVPKNEYPALQDRLLNSIKQQNTPKLVLSKLCQALAAFLANCNNSADVENKSKNIVEELFEILPYDSPDALELLLRVLSSLPGEFEKRAKIKQDLLNGWCKIAWLLQQVFSTCNPNSEGSNSTLYLLGIECALFWLKTGLLPLETIGQIYPHLLVAASHYAPDREGSDDDNVKNWEIVQESIIMILTHCELNKRPQTLWEWARSLVSMAQQHGGKYFCEILSAIGETHSRAFLVALAGEGNESQKWTSERLIELLLECSEQEGRYPTDETRSCIPFGFWYALQDDLATIDQPLESRALYALKPVYARLAQALLKKSTLAMTESESGNPDEQELFRCYRQDVADTLDYCYCVLRQDLLILLGQRLSQPESSQKWTDVESTLHAFKALAESVGTEESQYVPALMNLILSDIPYDLYPEEVLACACATMGAYGEWIGVHPVPWLERVLHLVTMGLTRGSSTAPFASMALKDIARECGSHLAPFAPSILSAIEHTLPHVTGREGLRLMYAAGKLLNTLPSIEEQLVHLDATLGLCIMKIQGLLQQPLFIARVAVTNQLKMATMFFTSLEGSVGKAVLDGLLPIFNQIIVHPEWSQDNSTLEAMHICAQRSLTSLLHPEVDARPLLPILLTSYKAWPHPAALNLLRQLVLLFRRDPDNVIGPVFAELSSITLSGVKACQSVQGDLTEWSELMEAYLGLLAQICKKNAGMLLRISEQIPDMLQCGISCLILLDVRAAKAASSFLTHAIMQCPNILRTFIQPIGQNLVSVIIRYVVGEAPRNNLGPLAEVLSALSKTCLEWTSEWLYLALDQPVPNVNKSQKEMFRNNILRSRRNKHRLCDVLKDFNTLCRQENKGF